MVAASVVIDLNPLESLQETAAGVLSVESVPVVSCLPGPRSLEGDMHLE